MKQLLLFITLLAFAISIKAQTTQTITIDWSLNSNPMASGNANTNRTIEVGDTVEWNWYATGFHNVVSNGGTETFNSGPTTSVSGVNFSYTFNQIGSTSFICQPHSTNMYSTITVVVDGTLDVENLSLENFSIFPNPATSKITLKCLTILN